MPKFKMPEEQNVSVNIRKIKNGWLATHSKSGPDKKGNWKHEDQTVFHRKHPMNHAKVKRMFSPFAKS